MLLAACHETRDRGPGGADLWEADATHVVRRRRLVYGLL